MRSDGGRGQRWTAGAGGGGLGLRERDAGEELAAGTRAHGCGGGDVGAGMRRRERWDVAARDAARAQGAEVAACGRGCGREMQVGPLNGPFPHSSHFMSTDLLFFFFCFKYLCMYSAKKSICTCINHRLEKRLGTPRRD